MFLTSSVASSIRRSAAVNNSPRPINVFTEGYRGVPSARYQELLAADSKGSYARDNILHCYPYERIYVADGPEGQLQSVDQRLG
ncbi:MAG: KTSC domain-containing protein [Acidobacteriia bacterium]|nr:KTSC domain-containing protein [Terriglobia bacterium]